MKARFNTLSLCPIYFMLLRSWGMIRRIAFGAWGAQGDAAVPNRTPGVEIRRDFCIVGPRVAGGRAPVALRRNGGRMSIEDEATGHARLRRIHLPHAHLESAFGNDWFGKKAEDFARFFGTPTFLVAQTLIVALWILVNAVGLDPVRRLSLHSAQSRLLDPGRLRGAVDPAGADPSGRPRQGRRASPTPSIAKSCTRSASSARSKCGSRPACSSKCSGRTPC